MRTSAVPKYVSPPQRRLLGLPAPAWAAIVAISFFVAIELYARSGRISRLDLVPVTEMVGGALELLSDREFVVVDLGRTFGSILASFGIAALLGVILAYVMTQLGWVRAALEPYLDVFYAVPTFAVYPVMVVLFGAGVLPIILLATAFSVVIVIANSFVGFCSIPPIAKKMSVTLQLNRWQHLRLILLPAALPDILTGLKLGMAYAIIGVLGSEFILASEGLGDFVSNAYNTFDSVELYGAILVVAVFALLANYLLDIALSQFDWRRR